MLLVICYRGRDRYEMTFSHGERATAEAFAVRYNTTVLEPGALVSRSTEVKKPSRRRKVG